MAVKTVIIVPTYNEAENIPELCGRIRQSLSGVDYSILVMDDSPGRHTLDAALKEGCGAVWRTSNRGLSPAVLEGIGHARARSDCVVVMDADLQHPPEALPRLLKALETHDFVVASRYVPAGSCGKWGLRRRLISRVANLLAAPLVAFKVKDLSSGFFGFRTNSLGDLTDVRACGFKVMLELLIKNPWRSVHEVPYTFDMRAHGESKLSRVQVVGYLRQLVDLYLHRFRWIRFGLVGLVGAVISYPILYSLTEYAGLHYVVSAVCAVLVGATCNYYLNNRWTFKEQRRRGLRNHLKGWLSYQAMAAVGDYGVYLVVLVVLTELAGLWYMLSAVIALFGAFAFKYTLAKRFIWRSGNVRAT